MRGPLPENWKNTTSPIMCSYKVVEASFEVWGIQSKAEEYIQKVNIKYIYIQYQCHTYTIMWYCSYWKVATSPVGIEKILYKL